MIDAQAVLTHLDELRSLTADENGAQRLAWSPTWQKARAWFEAKLNELPVEHHHDAAGNHWVTLPGESERAVVLGSHLDSIPNGGWLDGCLGVLTGLEVIKALAKRHNGRPPCTIRLVDWADEEGARFGRSLFGSSAFAGTHTIEADRMRMDSHGITLASALKECGLDIDRIGEAAIEQKNMAAYLELRIEQGLQLELAGAPLGVVDGSKGAEGAEPIAFHPRLTAFCDEAVRELTGNDEHLSSGPLCDAAEVARLGVPTAMIFVQAPHGSSQSPLQGADRLHVLQAAEAFGRAAESTMHWVAGEEVDLWAVEDRTPHTNLS
ncbi:MAG: M20/M25/M40 family metallo-hydrolase [Janthinobacterium lividum]